MSRPYRSVVSCAAAVAAAFGWLSLAGLLDRDVARAANSTDFRSAFARAADRIKAGQTPEGYWPTPVTLGPSFDQPVNEVNVFTPAVLVDLLDPIAAPAGLTGALARAREYLRRQIEATGLVRYHGDPGPVPAVIRGCELPPDADDTALVWRIAPLADRARLEAARAEIERYREPGGLYRTWLASDGEYRCFYIRYAGREWNPPDVAVEMHVYLFLAEHDAPAATRLCRALGRSMDDDRIWAWYTVAPLVPLLRTADLARRGCSLEVPAGRLVYAVRGQEGYLTQARLLRRLELDAGTPSRDASAAEPYVRALRIAAADDFAMIERTPPLLYHNDLSASPPHFHWSPEFGYALWLRLYAATAERFPGAVPSFAPSARPR